MIAHLSGSVQSLHAGMVVLSVHGVGYRVYTTQRLLTTLGTHDEVSLHIYTAVREDAIDLFGFATREELELFELLVSISGIGPRSALGIIGLESVEALTRAIAHGDVGYLTKVSGVGKKSAEKIVLELRDKVTTLSLKQGGDTQQGMEDVLEALLSLGYRADEAREAIRQLPEGVTDSGARVKEALRFLSHS